MSNIFERFPDFIQEFIYAHNWESLREVQVAAAETIFETDRNLLLTSSTASGKTEAAFFPILAKLCEDPPMSVGVLYIAPLKSLINDQFYRMEELLDQSGVRVTHWHGDVAQSHKKKLLEKPQGILQVTPESLESMLINRSNDIVRLFGDLRFVVIDEIHTLTGSDRGNQILCQLARIGHLIGHHPRRVGLSATIGDPQKAADWLGAGSGRETDVPQFDAGKVRWRLGMEHFYIQNAKTEQATEPKDDANPIPKGIPYDAGYSYMYDCVHDRKSLVFSNSREETEYLCATFRQIAKNRGDNDVFLIHHGNLSAPIREENEGRGDPCRYLRHRYYGAWHRYWQTRARVAKSVAQFGHQLSATAGTLGQTGTAARDDDGVPRGRSATQHAAAAAHPVGAAEGHCHRAAVY